MVVSLFWWGKVDSNHRRHCQQIYSLSPLATREFPHIHFSPPLLSEQSPAERVCEEKGDTAKGASFRIFAEASRSVACVDEVELVDGLEPPTC